MRCPRYRECPLREVSLYYLCVLLAKVRPACQLQWQLCATAIGIPVWAPERAARISYLAKAHSASLATQTWTKRLYNSNPCRVWASRLLSASLFIPEVTSTNVHNFCHLWLSSLPSLSVIVSFMHSSVTETDACFNLSYLRFRFIVIPNVQKRNGTVPSHYFTKRSRLISTDCSHDWHARNILPVLAAGRGTCFDGKYKRLCTLS